jgi:hypothetical protein
MKIKILTILLLSFSILNAQESKKTIVNNINSWYSKNPSKYSIEIKGDQASAQITRYHPERKEELDDLIRINYKGMRITLAFTKPLNVLTTNKDSLQKYFSYLSIDRIYNHIPSKGWDIYPKTPSNSLRGKGVTFTIGGDSISLNINWTTYTVFGYKDSEKCNNERAIMDGSVSESCYVSVEKKLPLEIQIIEVPID